MLKTLHKYLASKNIAEFIDDEDLNDIADDVITGYDIDDKSRQQWLEINREAMKIIKQAENEEGDTRNSIFEGQAKLVFPLITPATIQLTARLTSHLVRNGQTVEFKVLGKDSPVVDPQTQQPTPGLYVKAEKARKVGALMNYDMLNKERTWKRNKKKTIQSSCGWGVGFEQTYYDDVTNRPVTEFIHPENVVINKNVISLEDAPRITVKHYLTKNDIVTQQRAGYFLDIDIEDLKEDNSSKDFNKEDSKHNDENEIHPTYLFLCQDCYMDLDDDGYEEPYRVYIHYDSKQVFSIVPAFEYDDLSIDQKGDVVSIKRRLEIDDCHCIEDPEGGYYSIGLNYILLHPNKALTAIQRQLIDAGTLSNAAAVSGFATKAFRTRERRIKIKLGEFPVLDCNPNVDPSKQIIQMPFREPSQVLLSLFQLLIEVNNKQGFISDILTGDTEMQNVPATTALAATEQATRAFQPLIDNLYTFLQSGFEKRFHIYAKHLDQPRYVAIEDDVSAVQAQDFDEASLDIVPVADPTMSSEAFKYSRQRAMVEGLQVFGTVTNLQEAAIRYYTDMGFSDPQKLVQQQPQQPDPKIVAAQLQHQIAQQQLQLDAGKLQLEQEKVKNHQLELAIKSSTSMTKTKESAAKVQKLNSDAMMNYGHLEVEQQKIPIENKKADAALIAAHNAGKFKE